MKFGIVGCGFIAKKHAKALSNIEGAEFVAVCDKVEDMMKPYKEEYGVETYTELTDMLQSDIDVVSICTPSGFHAPLALEIAKASKHIIVEKTTKYWKNTELFSREKETPNLVIKYRVW